MPLLSYHNSFSHKYSTVRKTSSMIDIIITTFHAKGSSVALVNYN